LALLAPAFNLRSHRQLFFEITQLTKWPNAKLKDWEVDWFWEDPSEFCRAKEWDISPFEQILCMARTRSPELVPAVEAFIKNTLSVDVTHPTKSLSIR